MLDKARQLYQLQKQAKKIQKELKNTEIEASNSDKTLSVVYNGEQKLVDLMIDDSWLTPDKKSELIREILKLASEANSRASALAAEEMKGVMKDMGMNIPGF